MALLTGGGYAEQVAVDAERLIPLPDGASFAEGASFLLTFLTAWIPLTRQVRLEPGQTVLVHAGSGGVGTAAIQVARHLGARVVATASTEEKRPLLRRARRRGGVRLRRVRRGREAGRRHRPRRRRSSSRRASASCRRWARSSASATPAAGGRSSTRRCSSGRNVGVQGFYLGRLMARRPDVVVAAAGELLEALELRRDQAGGRRGVSPRPRLPTPTG